MKIWVFIGILFVSAGNVFAQLQIKGKITDGYVDLPAVTVLLLDTDSTMIKGVITDVNGEFILENISPGSYFLSASMVGYVKHRSGVIAVTERNIILPEIMLKEGATELGEVIVRAEKPLFEQKIDRLVVNVQSSISSTGNTILEVLQKSPGIVVNRQNNTLTMNGKSGVRVMINGKMMLLPPEVVVQMLDGMNASNVEKIELITTPPAEFDAEGNAGVIHIVTKGDLDFGTNASLGLTVGARWAETLGGNLSLHHRSRNFAYFFDYSLLRNHNLHILRMERSALNGTFPETINAYSHRENVTTQQNLSAGFETSLGENTSLNLLLTGFRRDWELDAKTTDQNVSEDKTVTTLMNIGESNIWQSVAGSLGLQTKLNSKSEIGLNLDYLYYHNDNPSNYTNNVFSEQEDIGALSHIDLGKKTPIHFFVAKADYQVAINPSFALEAGLKGVASTLDNRVLVQRKTDDDWITDPALTSFSTLNERIGAGYISTKWTPEGGWQINTGMRYEFTNTTIDTPGEKNLIDRKYGYLFPSVSVSKNVDVEKIVRFSYSKRITRPTYKDIAPFVFFWGPTTFSAGNTSLFPAIADAITAGYQIKQWMVTMQVTHTRNEIIFFQPEFDEKNNLIYRSQNLEYANTIGLTNSYSLNLTPRWEIQSNVTAQYQEAKTAHLNENVRMHRYGLNFNLTNIIRLPRDFSVEISGMYQSRSLTGVSYFMPLGSLNAGVQKDFGKKGTLRVAIDDILYTNLWHNKTDSPESGFKSSVRYDMHNQFLRMTYSRNLGNNKLRSVKMKSGSDEERRRVGS